MSQPFFLAAPRRRLTSSSSREAVLCLSCRLPFLSASYFLPLCAVLLSCCSSRAGRVWGLLCMVPAGWGCSFLQCVVLLRAPPIQGHLWVADALQPGQEMQGAVLKCTRPLLGPGFLGIPTLSPSFCPMSPHVRLL